MYTVSTDSNLAAAARCSVLFLTGCFHYLVQYSFYTSPDPILFWRR